MAEHIEGSCFCGAVKMRVEMPPKSVFHCHCTICRRLHGAPYVTWVVVEEKNLQIAGEMTSFSSPKAVRARCSTCGAPTTFRPNEAPGIVLIPRASFGDHAHLKVQWQGFWEDRAAWVAHDEALHTSPR